MSFNLLLLLLAALGAVLQASSATSARLGEEFKLKIGREVRIAGEKLSIRFNAVRDESRCPTGVQCVWEGNAGVVVELSTEKGKVVEATLNTSIKPNQLEHEGYKIKLVGLNPYPKADQRISPKDYEAVLVVTKD